MVYQCNECGGYYSGSKGKKPASFSLLDLFRGLRKEKIAACQGCTEMKAATELAKVAARS